MTATVFGAALIPFTHIAWVPDGGTDSHGNATGAFAASVAMQAFACYPMHWRNPHVDSISSDYEARTEDNILFEVADTTLFNKLDLMVYDGRTYQVQGVPAHWAYGSPWQWAAPLFPGGTVHARRVSSTAVIPE